MSAPRDRVRLSAAGAAGRPTVLRAAGAPSTRAAGVLLARLPLLHLLPPRRVAGRAVCAASSQRRRGVGGKSCSSGGGSLMSSSQSGGGSKAAAAVHVVPLEEQTSIVSVGQEPTRQLVFFDDLEEQMLDGSHVINLPAAEAVQLVNFTNINLDRLVAQLGKSKQLWRRVLVLHEWLLLVGHEPDTRLCTTVMRLCCNHGEALRSLALYDWMQGQRNMGGRGLRPDIYTYTAAMRAAISSNKPARALQIWEESQEGRAGLDSHLVCAAMEAHVRLHQPKEALRLFQAYRQSVKPGLQLYNAAMRAAALAEEPEVALEAWEELQATGIKPSLQAYTSAIAAVAVLREPGLAYTLYKQAVRDGVRPDSRMFTALATAFGSQNQWKPAVKVLQLMLQSSVPPTVFTYSAIIGGMVGAGELDRALHLHDKMQAPAWGSVKPNAYTYSSLIIGMGRAGRFADARALFCCAAEAAGLDGEELVRPAGRADLPSLQTNDLDTQLDEGSELADGKDLGHECLERETDASRPQQDLMNNVVVGAMLGACERCGRWQEGLSLLRAVENGKVPGTTGANIVMINSVLSVLGKAGQWRLAGEVYSRHVEVCDQVSRETLIAAYGGGGRVREAEIVFRDILGRGEAPKDYAFCGLIAAYRAANRPRAAFQIRARMRALDLHPTVHVYNELLAVCERNRMWDKALELRQAMKREGVEPNRTTHDLLSVISEKGMQSVEDRQAAVWSAAATVAGAILVRGGVL